MAEEKTPELAEIGAPAEPVKEVLRRESRYFSGRLYARAHKVLEGLLKRGDLSPNQRFETLCRKAECLERLGQSKDALEVLRAVVKAWPDEPLGFSLLGEYLYRIAEDSAGALAALARAVELSPDDPESHWWRGQVYQSGLGDLKRAREAYLAALKTDRRYAPAMESLATICEAQGRWIEAIEWRKSHYSMEKKAASLTALAELYMKVGNFPAALKYAGSSVRRSAHDAGAWLTLTKALTASNSLDQAMDALTQYAKRAHPKAGPLIYSRDMVWLQPLLAKKAVAKVIRKYLAQ